MIWSEKLTLHGAKKGLMRIAEIAHDNDCEVRTKHTKMTQ
jgi:hypothetical protein